MIQSDEATADRAVQQLQKVVGVREARAFPPRDGVARELALVKVRAPADALRRAARRGAALPRDASWTSRRRPCIVELTGSETVRALVPPRRSSASRSSRSPGAAPSPWSGRRSVPVAAPHSTGGRSRTMSDAPCACTTTPMPTAAGSSGRTFAIIGYGSQGHAHALNLRDSGAQVIVGPAARRRLVGAGRGGRARCRGRSPTRRAAADVIMMLVPDQDARDDLRERRGPGARGRARR